MVLVTYGQPHRPPAATRLSPSSVGWEFPFLNVIPPPINFDRLLVPRNCCEGGQQSQTGYSFKLFSTFQAAGRIHAQLVTRYRGSNRANDHQAAQQVGVRRRFHTLHVPYWQLTSCACDES